MLFLITYLLLPYETNNEISNISQSIIENINIRSLLIYDNYYMIANDIAKSISAVTVQIINTSEYFYKELIHQYPFICIIVDNIGILKTILINIYNKLEFSHTTKYLLIYQGEEQTNDIFETTWDYFITSIIIIDKFNKVYSVLRFETHCRKNKTALFLFELKDFDLKKVMEIYTYETYNFNTCIINAIAFETPPNIIKENDDKISGIDVMILDTVANKYNFTVKYISHNSTDWGYKLPNGTYKGLLKLLYDHKGDILIGAVRRHINYLNDFEFSESCSNVELAFYIKKAHKRDYWHNIIKVYSIAIWISIAISMITLCLILYTIKLYQVGNETDVQTFSYLQIVGILVSEPQKQPTHILFRWLFITWTICSYFITSSYESTFLTFLLQPLYEPQINSVEEIVASGIRGGGFGVTRNIFENTSNSHNDWIYQNWITCPNTNQCITRTIKNNDIAVITSVQFMNYQMKHFLDSKNRSTLHQIPPTMKYNSVFVLLKGFPLVRRLNTVIPRMREGGFLLKWENDISSAGYINNSEGKSCSQIKVEHVLFSLYLYGFGISLAFVIFIVETLVGYIANV